MGSFGSPQEVKCVCAARACLSLPSEREQIRPRACRLLANARWIQVLYCKRSFAEIYQLKRIVNLFYLLATAATGQVAFRGYARVVRVRQLRQILPSSFASVRRHLVDRTPVRRKILKPTPKIFGVT